MNAKSHRMAREKLWDFCCRGKIFHCTQQFLLILFQVLNGFWLGISCVLPSGYWGEFYGYLSKVFLKELSSFLQRCIFWCQEFARKCRRNLFSLGIGNHVSSCISHLYFVIFFFTSWWRAHFRHVWRIPSDIQAAEKALHFAVSASAALWVTDGEDVQPIGRRLSPTHTGLWTLRPNIHTQPKSAV